MKPAIRKVLILVAVVLASWVVVWLALGPQAFDPKGWGFAAEHLRRRVHAAPLPWGLAFVGLVTLAGALSFPVLSPFGLAAGIVFGTPVGTILAVVGGTLGGLAGRGITNRFAGKDLRIAFPHAMGWFQSLEERFGPSGLLFLRLLPLLPCAVFNTLSGLVPVPLKTFVWVSLVGLAPVCFAYAWMGRGAFDAWVATGQLPGQVLGLLAFLVGFSLLGLLVRVLLLSHKKKAPAAGA